jgi:hypothetical protein
LGAGGGLIGTRKAAALVHLGDEQDCVRGSGAAMSSSLGSAVPFG